MESEFLDPMAEFDFGETALATPITPEYGSAGEFMPYDDNFPLFKSGVDGMRHSLCDSYRLMLTPIPAQTRCRRPMRTFRMTV